MKDDRKSEDYIRFENFLAGTGNEFIGRGAPKSATATHILHLKQLKNPVDFIRYVKGVVFPGREFMIEKYGRLMVRSALPLGSAKNDKLLIINGKIGISWRFLYCYRWWTGLKGFWYVVTGTSTSSVTSTEKKKEK